MAIYCVTHAGLIECYSQNNKKRIDPKRYVKVTENVTEANKKVQEILSKSRKAK
jgi:hypothetical protein